MTDPFRFLLPVLLLLFTSCSGLSVPVDLANNLGELKQGQYTLSLPGISTSDLTLTLPTDQAYLSQFNPPPIALTSAALRVALTYSFASTSLLTAQGSLQLYLAPKSSTNPFDPGNKIGQPIAITLDPTGGSISTRLALNAEQLSAFNTGSLKIGFKVNLVNLRTGGGTVTFKWTFSTLIVEAGVL